MFPSIGSFSEHDKNPSSDEGSEGKNKKFEDNMATSTDLENAHAQQMHQIYKVCSLPPVQ